MGVDDNIPEVKQVAENVPIIDDINGLLSKISVLNDSSPTDEKVEVMNSGIACIESLCGVLSDSNPEMDGLFDKFMNMFSVIVNPPSQQATEPELEIEDDYELD